MSEKMQIINNYEKAYEIARPYIDAASRMYCIKGDEKYNHIMQLFKSHVDDVPTHATSSRWKMTDEALQNTLKYIFYKLAHNCYMLCVDENGKKMFKIQHLAASVSYDAAVQEQLAKLDSNKLITERQRDRIHETASKPVRIMQCIMKNFKDEGAETNSNEYADLMQDLSLPYGVFILNLTDAVILHRNNKEPFPFVTGNNTMSNEYENQWQIPIFSMSGQKKYSDIPIPNYDDVFIVTGENKIKFDEFVVDWNEKKINKAIFRGGPSGCGYTAETNQRIHLATLNSPLLDVKLTGKGKTIDSNSIKFDPIHGLGMLNTGIKPAERFMTMAEQSEYKYIIHVDGNVNAYRLLTTMMTGSLIIRVDGPYLSWVDQLIKPGQHYVLVRPDLSDLISKIEWCETHPKTAQKIAKAGYEFAKRALTRQFVNETIEKTFWTVMPMLIKQRVNDTKKLRRKNKQTKKIKILEYLPHTPESPPPDFPPHTPDFPPPPLFPNMMPKSPDFSPPPSPPINKPPKSPDFSPPPSPPIKKPPKSPDFSPPPSPPIKKPPKSPDFSPPSSPPIKKPPKSPDFSPPLIVESNPLERQELIEMPPGAKKCPDGYLAHMVNGKKMCKRKTQKKVKDI
jgi:hypothetical protein